MLTLEFALAELVNQNVILEADARRLARDPSAMTSRLRRLRHGPMVPDNSHKGSR